MIFFYFSVYIKVVAALLVIASFLILVALVVTVLGLNSNVASRKYLYYRIAMYFALLAGQFCHFGAQPLFPPPLLH